VIYETHAGRAVDGRCARSAEAEAEVVVVVVENENGSESENGKKED
jgi:hypothetical protein